MIHDYYKGPYKSLDNDSYIIVSESGNRVFDFAMPILFSDAYDTYTGGRQAVITKLNEGSNLVLGGLDYESPIIRITNQAFIVIHGINVLTGKLGLKPIEARKIQDQFAQWIMDTLSK